MLWIAGGIGVTPFLAFLGQMARSDEEWEVQLMAGTKEPEIIAELVREALRTEGGGRLKLGIRFFSSSPPPPDDFFDSLAPGIVVETTFHEGRISSGAFEGYGAYEQGQVFLCGPPEFERVVLDGLERAGVEESKVMRESFDY